MNILYAIQATGNGHISRAMELIPFLQQYGTVDIFLSGSNSSLNLNTPIKYRSKGLSLFYSCRGNLDFKKTILSIAPLRIRKEVNDLPVEKYDLVLNDFECITALACSKKKIPSVNFGHQASFYSHHTPRPEEKSKMGEWILRNYARATFNVGLHFKRYDRFILPPVIKKEINEAAPTDKGFIAVYLPSYCEFMLEKYFCRLTDHQFRIFSFESRTIKEKKNIKFLPVDKNLFNDCLINCSGIITGGGFETPAEALKLQKKLMVIPIKGQYEQQCNAAALEQLGVKRLDRLDDDFNGHFENWIRYENIRINYDHSTSDIVSDVVKLAITHVKDIQNNFPYELQTTCP